MIAELVAANAELELYASDRSAITADNASLKDDNATMKAMLTQLIQVKTQSSTVTAHKTEPKTETETETKTEIETGTETETPTELQRMGVLQDSHDSITHSHDLPVSAIFTELENINVLDYTGHHQHVDTGKRRTVDPFLSLPVLQRQRPGTGHRKDRRSVQGKTVFYSLQSEHKPSC